MLNKYQFILKESMRTLSSNFRLSLYYFLTLSLVFFLFALTFIFLLNLNYLIDVSARLSLSRILIASLQPIRDKLFYFKIGAYAIFLLAILAILIVNLFFIRQYISSYQQEIALIKKLRGNSQVVKLPVLNIALLISFLAVFFTWWLWRDLYANLQQLVANSYLTFPLLQFNNFKFSLLCLELVLVTAAVLFSSQYLFWKIIHREKIA